jgi:hypothetical protein
MAFTGNFMCDSFLLELMTGTHNFTNGQDVFKIALYTDSAAFDADTTVYTAGNEVVGDQYVAGGGTLVNVTPTVPDTNTAITDFDDFTWSAATITARGAMIYNSTVGGDPAVIILDFGADKTSTAGDFTVQFPAATSAAAIIRLVGP